LCYQLNILVKPRDAVLMDAKLWYIKLCPFFWNTLYVLKLKGSVKVPNMFHNYETEKITRKASDATKNLQLYRVGWFFCPRSSCTTHLMLFSERPPINALCMTISGARTKQHVIIGFGELAAVD